MADFALELSGVEKIYGTGKLAAKVLHDINLKFESNSFNAIIGQSGSGKSTLLNLIGTLDTPSNGTIKILNKNTNSLDEKALSKLRNKTLGFIFQHHYLLPEFSVFENIVMPYRIKEGKLNQAIIDYANELIDFVDLTDVKNNKATNLSGGQQQRTAIARALINKPAIILADEPTGALDSKTTDKVYNLLRNIHTTYKTTFIVITHDQKVAEKTDRIIELKDGRVHLDFYTN